MNSQSRRFLIYICVLFFILPGVGMLFMGFLWVVAAYPFICEIVLLSAALGMLAWPIAGWVETWLDKRSK